ncbi:MAG: 50S ribosomal protein L18 [Deltaproteobacteria bacterium]|nr:50S ribosomal protein L18 [Deltaproteobacteria bacterium]MCW5805828.1 50S ribosomal protein L18 [Deltaproteobacteria bacterium]
MAGHVKVASEKVRKRLRRKVHIRLRVSGTAERPRLSVFRSARYVYAQAVDDTTGRVVAAASEIETNLKEAVAGKPKKERARLVGKVIGEKLVGLNVKKVVFDRNGFIFHGRVKEVADGAREAGLEF